MQFIYLFLSLYFGKKNSLFFLIFPLALIQGPGAFIDTRTVLVASEFFLHGRYLYVDISMLYLILVVLYIRHRVNYVLWRKTPMKLYFIFIIFLIIMTIFTNGTNYESLAIIRLWLYMFLGYFLLTLLFSTITKEAFIQFFNVLFWVNAIQSLLYVLNSSRIFPFFDESLLYRELEAGSDSFYRDFATIPIFSGLLFIYGLTSVLMDDDTFNRKGIYSTLLTYPFVLLFTFTRSVLFSSAIELILVLVVLIRYRTSIIFKSYVFGLFISGIVIFMVLKSSFNNEFGYFNERINSSLVEGKNEANVDIRFQYTEKAWGILIDENSLLFGDGLNKRLHSRMDQVGAWAADSTIPYLLISTGIIGVLLFYLNQFYFLIISLRCLISNLNPLAIALFVGLCSSVISSIIMGGNSWGSPFIFLNYALVMYNLSISITKPKESVLI